MSTVVKVALVQMDVTLGDREANLRRMETALAATRQAGALLTVFPECALTGYCFDSLDEARTCGETLPGPSVERLAAATRRLGGFVAYGLLETDGDRLFNACALVGPDGLVGSYRKVHLPFLGVDRFTTPGDRGFTVYQVGDLRVGMLICYDLAFPEASRVLALDGADLIVLPTNWPPGAQCTSECVVNTRALENAVYVAAVNRVGQERGFPFIGRSRVCETNGHTLAFEPGMDEAILYAELDLERARNKHIVRVPEKHEINRFADRRPEFYRRILDPVLTRNPRRV